jgi:stage III sporulation protein AG
MKFDFNLFQNNNKQKKIINILIGVFCVGLLIVLLFDNSKQEDISTKTMTQNNGYDHQKAEESAYSETIEKKLEKEFAKIDGVGRVEVIVTMKTKGEIVLNKDKPYNSSNTLEEDDQGGTRESTEVQQQEATVLIRRSDGSEEPMIIKELLPEVSGILIIAEGGDSPIVKNNLINAAKVLLDLPAHKIEVMKRVPE